MYNRAFPLVHAFLLLLLVQGAGAQAPLARLTAAWKRFAADPQLQAATASLHVVDASTGSVVFSRAADLGLQPASTQKIITAATAYILLGRDFRYATDFGYTSPLEGPPQLYVRGSGDPSLGSWRWKETGTDAVLAQMRRALAATGTKRFGPVRLEGRGWEDDPIPGGWIWDDLGNYYGAGASALNWRENQFDLFLRSGSALGSPVEVERTEPELHGFTVRSMAVAAAKGTGDNSYLYLPVGGWEMLLRGTIPQGSKDFKVSGAFPLPPLQLGGTLAAALREGGITTGEVQAVSDSLQVPYTRLYRHSSPPLDSLVYWFNRRSINLYGEAFLRTWAAQRGRADRSLGLQLLDSVWKANGVVPAELHLVDGSGLSPQNRVSTRAQVAVLRYARRQSWFSGYYASLPEYNGMKMKSGTIHRVKGFAGYHRSASGKEYVFSILVNNYNGPSASLVQKMYAVLDELKK